jgi:hypothetical protein
MATKIEAFRAADGTLHDSEQGAAAHDLEAEVMRLIKHVTFPMRSVGLVDHFIVSEDATRKEMAQSIRCGVKSLKPLLDAFAAACE